MGIGRFGAFLGLVRFLKVTGEFESYARNAIGRMAAAGTPLTASSQLETDTSQEHRTNAAQLLLDSTRAQWGWESPEEAHVTMLDLGLGSTMLRIRLMPKQAPGGSSDLLELSHRKSSSRRCERSFG